MKATNKEFRMFTEAGNAAVLKLVECAQTADLRWFTVRNMLLVLAQDDAFAEAADTAVMEAVWETLY